MCLFVCSFVCLSVCLLHGSFFWLILVDFVVCLVGLIGCCSCSCSCSYHIVAIVPIVVDVVLLSCFLCSSF